MTNCDIREKRRMWFEAVALCCAAVLAAAPVAGQQSVEQILKKGVVLPGKKQPQAADPKQPANQPKPVPARDASANRATAAPSGDNSGFRMDLPAGWRAQLTQNGAVVATGQGGLAVLIAPVLDAGDAAAGNWLQRSGASAVARYLRNPAMTRIYPSRMGPTAALASFDFGEPSAKGTANVLYLVNGGVGTLYVIAGPKAGFAQQRAGLVHILQSFTFTGEGSSGAAQAAAQAGFIRFQDPKEGAFTLEVPEGWKVEGGLLSKSPFDTRSFVWATSPDGSTVIRLRDPEFSSVPNRHQHYKPGPEFAQQYAAKLAGDLQASNLQFTAITSRQDLSSSKATPGVGRSQTTGGEAAFTCTRNGKPCTGKVIAATRVATLSPGFAMWSVDYLVSYLTAQERMGVTDRIFQHMLESVRCPQRFGMQPQIIRSTSQVVREAAQYTAKVFDRVHRNRERSEERIDQNRTDAIRGVVRLRDPNAGEELEGVAGKNYYYRAPGGRAFGTDREIRSPDFTELEQIRSPRPK